MAPRRSANPGKGVCVYLRGPHLSYLRTVHPEPGEAIRRLIAQAAESQPPPQEPEVVTPTLCEGCQRYAAPICPSCKKAFYG